MFAALALVAGTMLFAACDRADEVAAAPPAPLEVSAEAKGHYCGMLLSTHEGPKGQIHLASRNEPVWFSSVRDTVAFLRLPEEARDITAVYVNDMGVAKRWEQPEPGAWVDARKAWYVIDSGRRGGMGAPEAVPFSEREAAEAFVQSSGGKLVKLEDIPDSYVLGPVDLPPPPSHGDAGHSGSAAVVSSPGTRADNADTSHGGHPGQATEAGHESRPGGAIHRETSHSKH
jgi:copper chaperone NosL